MPDTTIHYNSSIPFPHTFKSQGQGECGKTGYITGYPGVVSCKACQKIADAEKAMSITAIKNQLGGPNGNAQSQL